MKKYFEEEEILILLTLADRLATNAERLSGWAGHEDNDDEDCKNKYICYICNESFLFSNISEHGRKHIAEYKGLMAFI